MKTWIASLVMCAGLAYGQIEREGDGTRRVELGDMERAALPEGLWESLSGLSAEDALTDEARAGKAILLVTWARWYPQSTKIMPMLEEIRAKHDDTELLIIAVHHERGFDASDSGARAEKMGIITAHDAEGKFRELLKVDQDPDFYFVDRAGNLRYADVANGSVKDAADELVAESREDAESLNDRLAEAVRLAEQRRLATDTINEDVDLREIPDVSFTAPEASEYTEAHWPRFPRDENSSRTDEADPVIAVPVPEQGWLPTQPPRRAGRAVVLYFWHPDVPATHERIIPEMDRLQRAKGRDLLVFGVLSTFNDPSRSSETSSRFSDPARLAQIMLNMVVQRDLKHWMALDLANGLLTVVRGDQFSSSSDGIQPYAAVISSDGILRWRGFAGTPAFKSAVETVLLVDPGVKARREAEDEYIRTRSK